MSSVNARRMKVGVIVNPIAGLGGRAGLKGSDLPDIVERAAALGSEPQAPARAMKALEQLLPLNSQLDLYTYSGDMGEAELTMLGFSSIKVLGAASGPRSTSADTMEAARKMKEAGVDLILFAGGDGTARNICEAAGTAIPVLGIPAGVKIHSAVYAVNPKNAGIAAKDFLEGRITSLKEAEVMDIDEDLFRQGRVNARLYGYMLVPEARARMQNMKSGSYSEEGELIGMAGYVVCNMEDDVLYIIGPGSTTRYIMEDLGLENTLLGVDVVRNKQLVASDVNEVTLWELVSAAKGKVKIIVTIIGGQGNLFGRGNQQISPRIIRAVGKENIMVVAGGPKLIALRPRPLTVDTGDTELDEQLAGFVKITIGFAMSTVYAVSY